MFFNRIKSTQSIIKCLSANIINGQHPQRINHNVKYCSAATDNKSVSKDLPMPEKAISKAMKAYLERAREHNEFMEEKTIEFQIGKRHLANMMGENPDTFMQEDIDRAIEYLFPSGLYDTKARPFMRPPEEVYPQRKAAEFDESGRPYHFLFYTSRSNFYNILYDLVEHMQELEKFEDQMIKKNLKPDPNLELDLSGFKWLEKDLLETRIVETISEKEYTSLITTLDRLVQMPYSYRLKDYIMTYCQALMSQTKILDVPKLKYDAEGRAFITIYECLRKTARGDVTIRSPGTGKISINGKDIRYFQDIQDREQLRTILYLEALLVGEIMYLGY